ncbi:GNAT family N-acetyltransferase [Paracoccus sp. DMF-8]|uniref:GNAT family N-acetyltransferase n=1 Tax=Paracoccus sp. DMF-8 TaxID=3019445 RepID=UPI0023E45590|nr:GNAT family N-acetyltransferase [Paracoccus sp. DMF-8]MDF3607705.1 GNAT family N-acetyltransferase [Paracoccus sp. DMF-8]
MIRDPELSRAFEESWPAAEYRDAGGFRVGRGLGGGGRVGSARALERWTPQGIHDAIAIHRDWNQPVLFRAMQDDTPLKDALAGAGLSPGKPTAVMVAPTALLAEVEQPYLSAIPSWPPLAVQREIWEGGSIAPARQAAMDRVTLPKMSILGRSKDWPVAAAFLAWADDVAMIHAIEVAPNARRQGMGEWVVRGAAKVARDAGASRLALAVTVANAPAIALYRKLGFATVGIYDYWE